MSFTQAFELRSHFITMYVTNSMQLFDDCAQILARLLSGIGLHYAPPSPKVPAIDWRKGPL